MPEKASIVLGFDYGSKHIGVAVGQTITQSATPLKTIMAKDGVPDWNIIDALIAEWQPYCILVGIPTHMDGSEQAITHAARHFAKALEKRFKLPVIGIDERLSTKEVRSKLFDQGGYRAIQKGDIDSLAAKLIVEQWLAESDNDTRQEKS